MSDLRCYIAGPLFSDQDRHVLEEIAAYLEEKKVRVFLPHRDAGDLGTITTHETSDPSRHDLFQRDLRAIDAADFIVSLLDGQDSDSGTCIELGIAFSRGLPIFGLKTDLERRGSVINNMVWGVCGSGGRVFPSLAMLFPALDEFLAQSNANLRLR